MSTLVSENQLHRYVLFTSFCTVLLLSAGALVTGTGSGLAVPDWPLSYGRFFPPMVGGVLFEHGHRLVAGSVALFTIGMAYLFYAFERRKWVRKVAYAALGAVFMQALLGGVTVLLRLPKAVSISHACLAQLFFSLTVVLAVLTSGSWRALSASGSFGTWVVTRFLCAGLTFFFFCQLVLGASVRHFKAGLAIPDFPRSFGHWLPSEFPLGVFLHFAHRIGAFLIVFLVGSVVVRTLRRHSDQLFLTLLVGLLGTLVCLQILLGATIIWAHRPLSVTTLHLVVGAGCLAVSAAVTVVVLRLTSLSKEATE